MIPQEIKQVYSKFKGYTYQDPDFSTYKIKTPTQFNRQQGGICWDFVGPIALELDKSNIPWECFYTVVNKTTHTYIIADNRYWIECSWQPYKGINIVDSYHDIEDLLKDYYGGIEIHTFSYDPTQTFGLTPSQFFDYLEQKGEYKGESVMRYRKETVNPSLSKEECCDYILSYIKTIKDSVLDIQENLDSLESLAWGDDDYQNYQTFIREDKEVILSKIKDIEFCLKKI